jgi:predicted DNA-binding protein
MDYKPYSQEWHRHRYLREALEKYIDDGVENQVILNDILNIVCARQVTAHKEFKKLSDLEAKLRE